MVLVCQYPIRKAIGLKRRKRPSGERVPFEIHDGYKGGFSVASERGG